MIPEDVGMPVSGDIWRIVVAADGEALKLCQTVRVEHIALALLGDDDTGELARRWFGMTYAQLRRMLIAGLPTRTCQNDVASIPSLVRSAAHLSREFGHSEVDVCHLMGSIICSSVLTGYQRRRRLWITYHVGRSCEHVREMLGLLRTDGTRYWLGDKNGVHLTD